MTVASDLIRSARRYRGMSGRALARAARASQPTVVRVEAGDADATTGRLDSLLRPLGYQLTILPTRRGTVASASESVRSLLLSGDEANARRAVWQLAVDLAGADEALRVALSVTPPAPTEDSRYDALLAGVTDHLLEGLPRPGWLDEPWRTLAEPWDVEPVESLRSAARNATPRGLSRHGVFLDPSELVDG